MADVHKLLTLTVKVLGFGEEEIMNMVVDTGDMKKWKRMPVRADLTEITGCTTLFSFMVWLDVDRYKQGQAYIAEDGGEISGILMYTPVKKGVYRAMEDRVITELRGVSEDAFEEDRFNGSYGVIVGPYFSKDSQEIEAMIADCIARNGNTRRYVAFADERTMPYFAVNGFKFIADVGDRYLVMR